MYLNLLDLLPKTKHAREPTVGVAVPSWGTVRAMCARRLQTVMLSLWDRTGQRRQPGRMDERCGFQRLQDFASGFEAAETRTRSRRRRQV